MFKQFALTVPLVIMLGSSAGAAQPGSRVSLGDFTIDATEVTIGKFRAFVQSTRITTEAQRDGGGFEFAGGWVRRPGWTYLAPQGQAGADDEPAVHVAWREAAEYCAWRGGRLPTLEQWKRAAFTEQRAAPTDGFVTGRTYVYAVGDQPEGMNNNRKGHVAVGTTKRGVNGLYDMGANVWEWLADRRGNDALTAGGSWWYGPEQSKAEGAQWKAASFYAVYIGFRCVY
jgi:formylglycine-generating enzyme required for sulfatase activity